LSTEALYIPTVNKSPGPRELPVKTDEKMGKKEVILSSFLYIFESKELRKYVICPRLQGKPINMDFNLIPPESQSSVTKPLFLSNQYIKEIPSITKQIAD